MKKEIEARNRTCRVGQAREDSPVSNAEAEDSEKSEVRNPPHLRSNEGVDGVDPRLPVEEGWEEQASDDHR